MKYISGTYSLNLICKTLGTPGDWHHSSLNWEQIPLYDSSSSIYGDFGIDSTVRIGDTTYRLANHLRACLDLIEDGKYGAAQQMREYYLSDESLTPIVFEKVFQLKNSTRWSEINRFMGKEYGIDWLNFLESGI